MLKESAVLTLTADAPSRGETTVPENLRTEIEAVCARIPPLWDLSNYVAVNPFLGFAGETMPAAAQEIWDGIGGRLLPGVAYYRQRYHEGAFDQQDLAQAAARVGRDAAALAAMLTDAAPMPMRPTKCVLTFAERYDQRTGGDWSNTLIRHAALWCSVQAAKKTADTNALYASWREAAQVDRSLEATGLAGWRAWARTLPATAEEAIAVMLERLAVTPAERSRYLYRLLGGVFGWACYWRRASWAVGAPAAATLADLLAMRICCEAALVELLVTTPLPSATTGALVEDETVLALLQEALEDGYAGRLLGKIKVVPREESNAARPVLQAAFCIDVRSELLRRHLEAQHPAIQTIGFAGFFGVSLDWEANGVKSARCPVLLQPGLKLQSLAPTPNNLSAVVKEIQQTPATFTYVELLGLAYGLTLAGDALQWRHNADDNETHAPFTLQPVVQGSGVPLASRVAMAAGILKNIGLRQRFARLILLCGHGSSSANNPHAAGLDCGACGGHSGAINSRVAALLLNDPDVRAGLVAHGWMIPEDTYFVPGLHNTTLDEVALLDTEQIPASHQADRQQLEQWLATAGAAVRAERAGGLGLGKTTGSWLDRLIKRRAQDWSEVRPEWALARNAAFIAARRSRTRGVDLQGRTFLHDYDWTTDPDNSILTLILTAPMVVASWINLQYFASTVDNERFGCGTKALHNRIGSLGVVLGNGGDLRTGLARQSVQAPDGSWYHEPLRLQVVVEAPCERIDAVLAANPGVKKLVENGWVRLFALDCTSNRVQRLTPDVGWQNA
ncbi:MAG: DUF2309 domain-containing protein [Caldilinea sp. CFX5]|nr:DUF2309 domain-containing protein [Caldilinea sp. CFX5]